MRLKTTVSVFCDGKWLTDEVSVETSVNPTDISYPDECHRFGRILKMALKAYKLGQNELPLREEDYAHPET